MNSTAPFLLDPIAMRERGRLHASEFRSAKPFCHVVLDDFLPQAVIDGLIEDFPVPDDSWRFLTDWGNSNKFTSNDESAMGPVVRQVISQFNSGPMIAFLEELTGITGLVPDPYLVGGGMHVLGPGGFLGVHADFNVHEALKLDRRLNLLLYLNPGWKAEWGGNLELWNANSSTCEREIVPIANRCVVFSTTDRALHGNPTPVNAPNGQLRRSLAFYYYTAGRPKEERAAPHTTLYPRRGRQAKAPARARLRQAALQVLPPIVVAGLRNARRRNR